MVDMQSTEPTQYVKTNKQTKKQNKQQQQQQKNARSGLSSEQSLDWQPLLATKLNSAVLIGCIVVFGEIIRRTMDVVWHFLSLPTIEGKPRVVV